MGFYVLSIKVSRCLKVTLLLLNQLVGFFISILNHLAMMFKPRQQQQEHEPECSQPDYVVVMIGFSFISVPVQTLISFIKKRVPVVEYGELLQRSAAARERWEEEMEMECPICLDNLDTSHLVRELPNCCHVFHQHCLDCWVHEGQVTCPICRSMLFLNKSFGYKHLLHHQEEEDLDSNDMD